MAVSIHSPKVKVTEAPTENFLNQSPNALGVATCLADIDDGIRMAQGGFRIVQGTAYAGQRIIQGNTQAMQAAGLPISLRNVGAARLAGYGVANNPLSAAGKAAFSPLNLALLGFTYGIDTYQYGWGSKSDVGLNSTEFPAALTTDTAIALGPPAIGAGVGFLIGGPPGALVGGGIGGLGSAAWGIFGRDATVSFTDEHIITPLVEGGDSWRFNPGSSTAFGGGMYGPAWYMPDQ